MIQLTDDGTMDTVLKCSECGEETRYNFSAAEDFPEGQDGYDDFIDWCIEDTEADHVCGENE